MPAKPTTPVTVGRFTVEYDRCDDGYSWHVIDADCECVDSYETRGDAIRGARDYQAEADAEDAETARDDVRDAIRDLLDGCEDDAKLAAVLAMLRG